MDKEEVKFYVPNDYRGNVSLIKDRFLDGQTKDDTIKIYYRDLQGNKFYTLMKRKGLYEGWDFFKTEKA